MDRVLAVIPARFAATRFPGKPLAVLWGKPLLQHVWERARLARGIDELLVATDDERVAAAARAFGAAVEMTSADCASGTDRVAEAARRRGERTSSSTCRATSPSSKPRPSRGWSR